MIRNIFSVLLREQSCAAKKPLFENLRINNASALLPRKQCCHSIWPSSTISRCRLFTTSASNLAGDASGKENVEEISKKKVDEVVDESKLSLLQRFKKMYRDYWYVLIPVHGVTSAVWFGSFFYAAKSGIDIVPLLEWMNVPEKFIAPVRGSAAGHVAVAYAMYKVATPLRYTVTLGGTTVSINYLQKLGYIKPVPSAQRFKEMYDEKKLALRKKREEIQARIRAQRLRLRRRMKRRPKWKTENQSNGK